MLCWKYCFLEIKQKETVIRRKMFGRSQFYSKLLCKMTYFMREYFLNTKKKRNEKNMTTADGVKNNSERWSKRWTKTSKSDIFWNVFRMFCYIFYEKCIKYNMKRRTLHFYQLLTIEYHWILMLFCCLWSITFMRFNLFSRTMFKIFEIKIHLLIILKRK